MVQADPEIDGSRAGIQLLNLDWACSSVWLERTPDKREVDGSTPSRPTMARFGLDETVSVLRNGGVAQRGLPALHAGGHRFDPVHLHHLFQIISISPVLHLYKRVRKGLHRSFVAGLSVYKGRGQ